jgi:mannose-1-phosphate guanylyltransferase
LNTYVVILAGGRGERFWPASRIKKPKQVLKLTSQKTLLQETLDRSLPIVPIERTFIITGKELGDYLKASHPGFPQENFIIEPCAKNTAPAICYSAAHIVAKHGDGIIVVLSSDHYISPVSIFQQSLLSAVDIVKSTDRIVLLGIQPNRGETGSGYIQVGENLTESNGIKCMSVESFKEKPSRINAQEFYLSGKYLWNSGNFIMRAGKLLEEGKKYLPIFIDDMEKYIANYETSDAPKIIADAFDRVQSISIDYAILEKTSNIAVLWGSFLWDDVGNWNALERVIQQDRFNNVNTGAGETFFSETYESTVYNDTDGLVVAVGVSDLVIIRMNDITMVMNKTHIPHIREIVEKIRANKDWEKYL